MSKTMCFGCKKTVARGSRAHVPLCCQGQARLAMCGVHQVNHPSKFAKYATTVLDCECAAFFYRPHRPCKHMQTAHEGHGNTCGMARGSEILSSTEK